MLLVCVTVKLATISWLPKASPLAMLVGCGNWSGNCLTISAVPKASLEGMPEKPPGLGSLGRMGPSGGPVTEPEVPTISAEEMPWYSST